MTILGHAQYELDKRILDCRGDWDIKNLSSLERILTKIDWPTSGAIKIDGHGISKMDSAGAWLMIATIAKLEKNGVKVRLLKFAPEHEKLLGLVSEKVSEEISLPRIKLPKWLVRVGMQSMQMANEFFQYLSFVGELAIELLRIAPQPKHWRFPSICGVIYRTGFQALPIIALLSFMIGVVITYQMGLQLKNYGANIYIVDLLGVSILREFAPLITAIMVAGRSGSAFTAQLGMMKINQEIDALDTMGIPSSELLLIPRIIGLFIALPLITMWANIFGIFGGMVMSNSMLNITWYDFLHRFPNVIPLRQLLIGMGKAPVFSLIISSIGCFQGIQVKGSADSVGVNTTRSVVLAIFFIILADAAFSILFSKLKL